MVLDKNVTFTVQTFSSLPAVPASLLHASRPVFLDGLFRVSLRAPVHNSRNQSVNKLNAKCEEIRTYNICVHT